MAAPSQWTPPSLLPLETTDFECAHKTGAGAPQVLFSHRRNLEVDRLWRSGSSHSRQLRASLFQLQQMRSIGHPSTWASEKQLSGLSSTLLFRLVKILINHRKEVIYKSTPIILKISIKLPSSTTTLFGQDFRILLTSLEPFIFLLFDFACAENSFLRMDWSERE